LKQTSVRYQHKQISQMAHYFVIEPRY